MRCASDIQFREPDLDVDDERFGVHVPMVLPVRVWSLHPSLEGNLPGTTNVRILA